MAEDAWRGMRSGRNLLEVSTADAASVDPQQQFSRADLRDRNSLHANVADATIHRRLHGGGNRLRLVRSQKSRCHNLGLQSHCVLAASLLQSDCAAIALFLANCPTPTHSQGRMATCARKRND